MVRAFCNEIEGKDYLFVPDEQNLQQRGIMAADCVICNQHLGFPVSILNMSEESKKLFRNTRLGWLTRLIVENVEQNEHNLMCPLNNEAESKEFFRENKNWR